MVKYPVFSTKELAEDLMDQGLVINASSRDYPLCVLTPFYAWPDRVIPVPGMPDQKSRSVEGIWQGLKLIGGKTQPSLFDAKKIKKRRTDEYGTCTFQLGDEEVDYVTARQRIFVPTYEWMYENLVPKALRDAFVILAENDVQLYIYDVDANPDIHDLSGPYSHSSLLVEIINKELQNRSTSQD
jgi:hypothetical protein